MRRESRPSPWQRISPIREGNSACATRHGMRRGFPFPALRECLDVLAEADMRLKSSRMDKRTVLEQAVAALILTGKRDRQGERRT